LKTKNNVLQLKDLRSQTTEHMQAANHMPTMPEQ